MTGVSANDTPLQYVYTLQQDKTTNNYVFTITFTGNDTVYAVNMTLSSTHQQYSLAPSLQKNTFFVSVPFDLTNHKVAFDVFSTKGLVAFSDTIHTITHSKSPFELLLSKEWQSVLGFIILVALVAKYVLFYETRSKMYYFTKEIKKEI